MRTGTKPPSGRNWIQVTSLIYLVNRPDLELWDPSDGLNTEELKQGQQILRSSSSSATAVEGSCASGMECSFLPRHLHAGLGWRGGFSQYLSLLLPFSFLLGSQLSNHQSTLALLQQVTCQELHQWKRYSYKSLSDCRDVFSTVELE